MLYCRLAEFKYESCDGHVTKPRDTNGSETKIVGAYGHLSREGNRKGNKGNTSSITTTIKVMHESKVRKGSLKPIYTTQTPQSYFNL